MTTDIEWTDETWNPIRGCARVSEGCRNCYAERIAARFSGPGKPYEGLVTVRSRHSQTGSATTGVRGKWSGEVRFVTEHLADPLRWKKPRRIFVNSMSDLFHEKLTNEQIAAVFGVMAACPQHTFQCLTKRPKRMREWFEWIAYADVGVQMMSEDDIAQYLDDAACNALAGHFDCCHLGLTLPNAFRWPLPGVWLGVSVENQDAADERIPELLRTPAAVRFLSCEPLLGEVNVRAYASHLDWLIAGCESGPGARPCNVEWLRWLRDQCKDAGVPYFLKQAVTNYHGACDQAVCDPAKHGVPKVAHGPGSHRKAGGVIGLPYLDGVQHAEFPP